jgi:hypothetical protein
MTTLLPCPFCGTSDHLRTYSLSEDQLPDVGEMILCDASKGGCGTRGPGALYADNPAETAESLWNTRPSISSELEPEYTYTICSTTFTSGKKNGRQVIYGRCEGMNQACEYFYPYANQEEFNAQASFIFQFCW